MNGKTDMTQLMIKVARMYYIYGMNQKKIAEQLEISRGYVCQILDKARESGIVEIRVNTLSREESELEKHLCQMFGLRKAIAIPQPVGEHVPGIVQGEMFAEACDYIDSIIKSGMIIAFSWGRTIYGVSTKMARHISVHNVESVPFCGGTSNLNKNIYVSEISTNIAQAYNGTALSIPLPAILESEEIKRMVCNDTNVKQVLDKICHADIALFTVGEFSEGNSVYLGGYIDDAQFKRLKDKGAVGDLCAHFINVHGEICDPDLDRRTVSIDMEQFAQIPHKVLVASGEKKARSLLGALRKHYADVVITSEETIHAMFKYL